MGYQFEGKHGRVFYLDGYLDPREILMREIRGEYDEYIDGNGGSENSNGKIVTLEGRETGTIIVAGMRLILIRSDATDMISFRSG